MEEEREVLLEIKSFIINAGFEVLETDISNFSVGAWLIDMVLGLQELKNWHRAAIISDNDVIDSATKVFNMVTIGEFKVFKHKDINEAIEWASQPKI